MLSYLVTQRTREIGIRMSLGASRYQVLGGLLREGMTLALAGVILGAAGAAASGKILASLLREVKPGDPLVYAVTALLLAAVALVALERQQVLVTPVRESGPVRKTHAESEQFAPGIVFDVRVDPIGGHEPIQHSRSTRVRHHTRRTG